MRNVFFFHLKSSFLVLEILKFIVVLAVLHLCLLSPQHKSCWCWLCRQLLYVNLFFISPLFLCLFNLEFQNLLLSVPSVPSCSFLLSIFSIILFSTFLSIPCSVFSLCLFALFSDLPYCFLFISVILSFLFPIALFCLLLPYALFLFNLFSFY